MSRRDAPVRLLLLVAALAAGASGCRPAPRRKVSVDDPARTFGRMHTLAFAGDTVLARRMHWGVTDDDASGPLGALHPLFDRADLALSNLEGVLSARGTMQDKGERNSFFYRGRPDLVRVLLAGGIDMVNQANNHAGDYGPDALADSLALLDAAGIQHVGAGTSPEAAAAPAFRTIGDTVVAVIGADATQRTSAAGPGRAGTNYLSEDHPDAFVAAVRASVALARRHAHLVFLTVHWGANNVDAPTDARRTLAHRLIDEAGVDAVLGHSAHRAQGVELYRDKPILYDAGNLLWDYDDDGPSHRGIVFRLHFDRTGVRWIEALPIRLHENRTKLDDDPAVALDRLAGLCTALGTELQRTTDPGDGAGAAAGVIAIADPPALVPPADPAGAPPDPTPHEPPHDLLFPVPATVVAAPDGDATTFDPPLAFANGIELVAWRIDTPRVPRHHPLVVTTWWRATAAVPERWEIFLHPDPTQPGQARFCGGGAGEHEPGDWSYPTNRWRPGDLVMDRFDVRPFADVPPGTYRLFTGLWRPDTQARLHVLDAARQDGQDRVPLATFEQTGEE